MYSTNRWRFIAPKMFIIACGLIVSIFAVTPVTALATSSHNEQNIPIPIDGKPSAQLDKISKREAKMVRLQELRKRVVDIAKTRRGSRYVYGATGPRKFDCSGLTMWAYARIGKTLPHYSGAQMMSTTRVPKNRLEPGDLLFFGPGGSQHVSMYIGHNKMIGANNPRVGIVVEPMRSGYWSKRYAGAGRVIGR